MEHDKPVEGNAKSGTETMNPSFGNKFDFDFKVGLVEETIPSDSTLWNHRTSYGNSGMDAVEQANSIDETQLSNGHCKQQRKSTWKIKPTWRIIHGM